jgi:glycerophosphoryl diester phosphodiesterase
MLQEVLQSKKGLLRIAHRGYTPENKMIGFQQAVDRGCNMIECDLRLSVDKHPVLIHDNRINRTTNGSGYVSKLPKVTLQFHGVPSLDEFLLWFQKQDNLYVALELKDIGLGNNATLLNKTIALLEKYNVIRRSIIISFNIAIVRSAKKICPYICTGLLYANTKAILANPFNTVRDIKADSLWVNHMVLSSILPLNKDDIPLCVWTVNQKNDIKCLNRNVVGIVSDDLQKVFSD